MTGEQYDWLTGKQESERPTRYYYEFAYTTGTLYFNFKPAYADTVHWLVEKPVSEDQFTAKHSTYELPPEYELAVSSNLAIILAPKHGTQASNDVIATATSSKLNLKANNQSQRVPTMETDLEVSVRPYNIWTDVP